MKRVLAPIVAALTTAIVLSASASGAAASGPFVGPFNHVFTIGSTVPSNGDVNPYGVAVVPRTVGKLVAGRTLVSNFNNKGNLQGTGTTIVEVSPTGQVTLFATISRSALPAPCPGGIGLTTALVVLRSGWVVVGSLPTKDGMSPTAKAGCLLMLNSNGKVMKVISGSPINGPWDMTALDAGGRAWLFVTNVLNGTVAASPRVVHTATVVRIRLESLHSAMPSVASETVIADGFPARTDSAALVVGPTGVGLGEDGTTLYVANSVANRVDAITNAVSRTTLATPMTVTMGGALNDPLALAIAPNGDILTTNGGDGNLVESTPNGNQVAVKILDTIATPPGPNGGGTLFGLAVIPGGSGVYFVDDGTNVFNKLTR
jgi:hypothetical protein